MLTRTIVVLGFAPQCYSALIIMTMLPIRDTCENVGTWRCFRTYGQYISSYIIIRYEDIGLVIAFLMGREYASLR